MLVSSILDPVVECEKAVRVTNSMPVSSDGSPSLKAVTEFGNSHLNLRDAVPKLPGDLLRNGSSSASPR
jgi:hypothetical protein